LSRLSFKVSASLHKCYLYYTYKHSHTTHFVGINKVTQKNGNKFSFTLRQKTENAFTTLFYLKTKKDIILNQADFFK